MAGRTAERGFNLPELMIALALGLFLLAAFLAVLQHCRNQFATNESLARLQDAGRQALSALIPDLEHAGFYGFTNTRAARYLRNAVPLAGPEELRQPTEPGAAPAGLPAGAHDCGINFAVDVGLPVQGSNNSYEIGTAARDCAPTASAGGARAGSDTLTVRHASLAATEPHAGRIQLYSRRFAGADPQDLFGDGRAPGPLDANHVVRDLEVRTYYVASDSVERPGWPALRVKALTEARGAAQFRDEEVVPGVEDLQVEFGLASGASGGDATIRYVAPDSPLLRSATPVAVRLWLRIRADVTERGFTDARSLNYAGIAFSPSSLEATQRRMLIERTVALRNADLP